MDGELFLMLMVLWITTTYGLATFFRFWFQNTGEGFHPHSVDIDDRHGNFLVVSGGTACKVDCAVKSISSFVAPRGSSSSQNFCVTTVIIAIVGILGSRRWFAVGDASEGEFMLATLGFASLLPVAAYELDISSDKFLTDKVLVTTWFIQKIVNTRPADAPLVLPFELSPHDSALRSFLFSHPSLKHLYPESDAPQRSPTVVWRSKKWAYLHMVGSVLYVFCVSGAVILNDWDELHSMVITASFFGAFCLCSYLTGDYMPVLQMFRFFLLVWNPFYSEPDFLPKLHTALRAVSVPNSSGGGSKSRGRLKEVTATAVAAAVAEADSKGTAIPLRRGGRSKSRGRGRAAKRDPTPPLPPSSSSTVDADIDESSILDTTLLRMAKARPRDYLLMVGYILVLLETVTFLTPAVAMGIQWITALCNEPGMSPIPALLDFLRLYCSCLFKSYLGVGGAPSSEGYPYVNLSHEHCVLMTQHCVWSDGEGATQLPTQLKAFWGFYPSGSASGGGVEL